MKQYGIETLHEHRACLEQKARFSGFPCTLGNFPTKNIIIIIIIIIRKWLQQDDSTYALSSFFYILGNNTDDSPLHVF